MGIGDPWRPTETRTYNASQSYYIEHLQPGVYTIEMYGGQGGNYVMGDGSYGSNHGGYGGHSKGTLRVYEDTDIYVYSGEKSVDYSVYMPEYVTSHYANHGGGWRDVYDSSFFRQRSYSAIGGGGSSEVRLRNNNLHTRLMVAGGGGGAGGCLAFRSGVSANGGSGGGDTGGDGDGALLISRTSAAQASIYDGLGATLNAPGAGGNGNAGPYSDYRNFIAENGDTHGVGYGGSAYYDRIDISASSYGDWAPVGGGSGGGGFHGGGGGLYSRYTDSCIFGTSGGGGSGYIYTDALSSENLPYYQYYPDCELNPETDYLIDYRNDDGIQEGLYTQQSAHTGDGIVTIKCQKLGVESRLMMWVKQDLTFVKAEKAWVKTDIAFNELQQLSVKVDNAFWPSK